MSWKIIGLRMEPFLSGAPLGGEEIESYFHDRERDLRGLRRKLETSYAKTLLVAGPSGVGKTTLLGKALGAAGEVIRIDLSRAYGSGHILRFLAREIRSIAGGKGVRDEDLDRFAGEVGSETEASVTGGMSLLKATIGTKEKKAVPGGAVVEAAILRVLGRMRKEVGRRPIVVLDELDHVAPEGQGGVREACFFLLRDEAAHTVMACRPETRLEFWKPKSRWKALFDDCLELEAIVGGDGAQAHDLLDLRIRPFLEEDAPYPLSRETEGFLGEMSFGDLRQLFLLTREVLERAIDRREGGDAGLSLPIAKEEAREALARTPIFDVTLTGKEEAYLAAMAGSPHSRSTGDPAIRKATGVGRTHAPQVAKKLERLGFIRRIPVGRENVVEVLERGRMYLRVSRGGGA